MEDASMLKPLLIGAALIALPLAGCDDKAGTSFTFNASGENGAMAVTDNGQSGELAVNVPGFSGKLKLPKIHLDGNDVEMNGVHLYPGSKVTGMNIDADHDKGAVHIAFDSPADPATVQRWFLSKLNDAGFHLRAEGSRLVGTSESGEPFTLELQPDGSGHAKGMITAS
jgi:hypothetical protein